MTSFSERVELILKPIMGETAADKQWTKKRRWMKKEQTRIICCIFYYPIKQQYVNHLLSKQPRLSSNGLPQIHDGIS
jgi:hypothetical protein